MCIRDSVGAGPDKRLIGHVLGRERGSQRQLAADLQLRSGLVQRDAGRKNRDRLLIAVAVLVRGGGNLVNDIALGEDVYKRQPSPFRRR